MRLLFLSSPAIAALVPAQTVNRVSLPVIFTDNAPESVVPPYIVIKAGSTDPMLTLESTYTPSLITDVIEIESISYSIPQARTISAAVQEFFQDYHGIAAAGSNQATAAQLITQNDLPGKTTSFNIIGGVTGANGVICPTFTSSIQAANTSQSNAVAIYPPSGAAFNGGSANAPFSLAAASTAVITNTGALAYSVTSAASVNGEPAEMIRAVLWQDESYSYDFPDEGRDTKFHILTLTFKVQYEQGQ